MTFAAELCSKPIVGERILLRPLTLADVGENYHRWMNSSEITKYLECRFFDNSIESLRDYVASKMDDPNNLFLAIVAKNETRHIGNIKLGPVDWWHRTADIGIVVGESDTWGKGYATEAIRLLVSHAFDQVNLRKVTASAYSNNVGSIAAFTKAGFQLEGTRKQQFAFEHTFVDQVMMGLVNPKYATCNC